ncbi:hypothetical protein DFQ27_006907 [Actinomortierella ambigua]|uniref:Uncharacterized protein n=1 Tax=Actinomortierella ambigua TaxID=1343610 RepID=A0A9P6U0F7_9FUNG|nr:hypothetical protein DFQ27_006907 [Actinomortierella ambigua]
MGDPLLTLTKRQKKLSIQNIVDKERNKLQITGLLKGSELIKLSMDLLAPEEDRIATSTSTATNFERNSFMASNLTLLLRLRTIRGLQG